jgi:hypothetical protein
VTDPELADAWDALHTTEAECVREMAAAQDVASYRVK